MSDHSDASSSEELIPTDGGKEDSAEGTLADKPKQGFSFRFGNTISLRSAMWRWSLVAVALVLTWLQANYAFFAIDPVVPMVLFFLLVFIGIMTTLVYLLGRIKAWTLAFVSIAVFITFCEVEGVSGDLGLHWKFRFAPYRDELLEIPENSTETAELTRTTPYDFPGFFGAGRDGFVANVALATDWKENVPEELWRIEIGAGWSGFVAVNGFAVTMEQRGEQELVTCYRISDGQLIWSDSVTCRHGNWSEMPVGIGTHSKLGGIGPRATPLIHKGKVYALGATGILRCLDGATGKKLWQHDLRERGGLTGEEDLELIRWARSTSPLAVNNLIVVPLGGKGEQRRTLIAFDQDTGDEVWAGGARQASYSSPALMTLNGITLIVSVNEASVSGHDIKTGQELWAHEWPGSSAGEANTSQPIQVGDSGVLVTKGYSGGASLLEITEKEGTWSTRQVWRKRTYLRTKMTSAILKDHFAYGLSNGMLECIDVDDGRRQWKAGRYGHGQILRVRDHLLVLEQYGLLRLLELSPKGQRELTSFRVLDGKCWNYLCLHKDILLVRNAEEAACFRLPLR